MSPVSPVAKKRRNAHKIETKRAALILLGAQPDGSFGQSQKNPYTNKPITHGEVAQKFSISCGLLSDWKKNATTIMSERAVGVNIRNEYKRRLSTFQELEETIYYYFQNTTSYIKGESKFREQVIVQKALEVRAAMVAKLEASMAEHKAESETYQKMKRIKDKLATFKASSGWAHNFVNRYDLKSLWRIEDDSFLLLDELDAARLELMKKLCKTPLEDISSTAEVALLYRSFPPRGLHKNDAQLSSRCMKDRLTAVLTIHADGTKGPLTIIGRSAKPRSFPKSFDPIKDLNVFYKSQNDAWNTKQIWSSLVNGFNNMGKQQGRKIVALLDYSSAHTIPYDFENYEACLLPLKLTSHLHPVDACVRRSFKAIFRKLLIDHLLKKKFLVSSIPSTEKPSHKISSLITVYEGVVLMAKAWDLVPKRVVLNGWLKARILVPHQTKQIRDILDNVGQAMEAATKVTFLRASLWERNLNELRVQVARTEGEKWMTVQDIQADSHIEDDDADLTELMAGELADLKGLKITEKFDNADFAAFLAQEEQVDVKATANEATAMHDAIETCIFSLGNADTESDVEEQDNPTLNGEVSTEPSIPRFLSVCDQLMKEIELFRGNSKEVATNSNLVDLKDHLTREVFAAAQLQRKRIGKGKRQKKPQEKTKPAR